MRTKILPLSFIVYAVLIIILYTLLVYGVNTVFNIVHNTAYHFEKVDRSGYHLLAQEPGELYKVLVICRSFH